MTASRACAELTPTGRRISIRSRLLTLCGCLVADRSGVGRRNAMIRPSLKLGIAYPITPGSIDVRVRRRLDLLTARGDLLETPVTLPVLSTSYIGRMRRRGCGYAQTALTVITGAASPLSIEDLESTPAGHLISIRHAKARDLSETIVAGPALLARAVVRIGGEVPMGLLGVAATQPPHRAREYHVRQGPCFLGYVDTHSMSPL